MFPFNTPLTIAAPVSQPKLMQFKNLHIQQLIQQMNLLTSEATY